ncbi:MAG TPA: ABC transporter substrate-binding protein, partial [Rhodospirillales bacterium]|nr:ABC transporter substrate-binding protein [Rhodospirillales bacterium]
MLAAFVARASGADEIRIGSGAELTSIDPHYWSGIPNAQMGRNIFDHLVHFEEGKLTPALAASWKARED